MTASDHLQSAQHRYTYNGRRLNEMASKNAKSPGTAEQYWEIADYHAVKGNYNDEEAWRRAARMKEEG